MFDVLGELNWLAIGVATITYYALGGLWFSQFVFGKAWNKSIGFEQPKNYKFSPAFYVGPFIGSLIASIATALLVYTLDVQSLGDGLLLGLITGAGYAGAVSVTNAITPTNPRPLVHGIINGAYHMVGIVVVALIITTWR